MGRGALLLEAGDSLLEALGGVPVTGIVGLVVLADAGDLLLQLGKALELGFARLGKMVGAFLKLAGEVGERAEPIKQVGKLLFHLGPFAAGLHEGDALEGAFAQEPLEQLAL
jgi:hypothetical protein